MMTGLAYMTGPTGRPLRFGSSARYLAVSLRRIQRWVLDGAAEPAKAAMFVSDFSRAAIVAAQHMVQFELEGTSPPPMPERDFSWPVYDIMETADGRQIFVGAVTEGQWDALCGYLGLDELLADARLQSRMDQINARSWTIPIVEKAIGERNYDNWKGAGISASRSRSRQTVDYEDPCIAGMVGLCDPTCRTAERFGARASFEIDGRICP